MSPCTGPFCLNAAITLLYCEQLSDERNQGVMCKLVAGTNNYRRSSLVRRGQSAGSDFGGQCLRRAVNILQVLLAAGKARGTHVDAIPEVSRDQEKLVTSPADFLLRFDCSGHRGWPQVLPIHQGTPVEHVSRSILHGLHSAAFPRSVKNLQLRHDYLLDQRVRLRGEHLSMGILLEDLDARPVDQKRVVQDKEIVVEDAERVTLYRRKLNRINDGSEKSHRTNSLWILGAVPWATFAVSVNILVFKGGFWFILEY